MKKANELRVGNYFQWIEIASMGIGVDVITKDNHYTYEDFKEPIPLTEDWLKRFGFDTDRVCWFLDGVNLGDFADGFWFLPNGSLTTRSIQIKYVHSIQNLYFALTGEELNQNKEDENNN